MISWFFLGGILASETEFSKKTQDITQKKDIMQYNFFFFCSKCAYIRKQKRAKTAKNGLQKKSGDAILNVEEIRGGYCSVFLVEIGELIKFAKL